MTGQTLLIAGAGPALSAALAEARAPSEAELAIVDPPLMAALEARSGRIQADLAGSR